MESQRPDLVLVMTDQQRWDQAGYAGNAQFETPHMDRLAAGGTVFEAAYSTGTTCVPGRIGLLTGVQPHRVPTGDDGLSPAAGVWTVARALRAAGYQTALVGKMHLRPIHADCGFDTMVMCEHTDALSPGRPADDVDDYRAFLLDEGLVDWRDLPPIIAIGDDRAVWGGDRPLFPFDVSYLPTEWIVREVRRTVRRRDPSTPLFLVVSFLHPHAPYNPPAAFVERFDVADAVLPADGPEVNDGLPAAFRDALLGGPTAVGPYRPSPAPTREVFSRRLITLTRAMMAHVDDAVGRVLSTLDLSRAVVALTADHGDYGGHRGLVRKVPWIPFDDLARVPLVVRPPGGGAGQRHPHPVQSSDLVPTFLDYGGAADPPHPLDSRSLRPVVEADAADVGDAGGGGGGAARGRSAVGDPERLVCSCTTQGWPMARRGLWKLIWRGDDRVLFDLEADPGETVDRHGDPAVAAIEADLFHALHEELARPSIGVDAEVEVDERRVEVAERGEVSG